MARAWRLGRATHERFCLYRPDQARSVKDAKHNYSGIICLLKSAGINVRQGVNVRAAVEGYRHHPIRPERVSLSDASYVSVTPASIHAVSIAAFVWPLNA